MMKRAAVTTVSIYAGLLISAVAQTTPQTAANITITNNLSKNLTIESSTCGSTETCTINQNSAMAGKSASETLVTKDNNSGSWVQRWGGYIGTTDYGCNFSLFVDSVAPGSTCHNLSGSASASSGP